MGGLHRISIVLAASLFASVATAAATADFRARGNEPGWSVTKNDQGISFTTMEGKTVAISPLPAAEAGDGGESFRATSGGQPFVLSIVNQVCVDTMSGMPFPSAVSVEADGIKYAGCGGEPATLLHGDWIVEKIGGSPVREKTEVSLSFSDDGQVSGSASCNRYFGGFVLTGEGLSIKDAGSTMMMCDQPVMDQEAAFLKALKEVSRFEIAADGGLILHANDGPAITARRKG